MKVFKALTVILILLISVGGAFFYFYNKRALPTFLDKHTTYKKYIIKKAGKVIDSAEQQEEAIALGKQNKRVVVINTYNNEWVYTDLYPYMIITETAIHDFKYFEEAVEYAKANEYNEIYYKDDTSVIWKANPELSDSVLLDVPLILQYPELPRGCEVTSLAMILRYRGINADKMILAEKIKKDLTPYNRQEDGRITYGNPYEGFVGDMYNLRNNGYGVYHGPIAELAKEYLEEKVIDLTELPFEEVLYFIEQGNPVWVITNSTFRDLDDSYFEYWHTSSGIVKVTKKLHSVVITGFNEKQLFINDPLYSNKNRAVNREQFKKAWEQMGSQAITILK